METETKKDGFLQRRNKRAMAARFLLSAITLIATFGVIPNQSTYAQGLINNGANLVLSSGSKIVIHGSTGNYTGTGGSLISNYSVGGQISLQGNWINNSQSGGFQNNGSIILFNGTNQIVGGSDSTSIYNMSISNSTLTLTGPQLKITNALFFSKGIIHSFSGHYLEFANSATVAGASDSAYADGPVIKNGNQSFVFPVGANNLYRPIEISAPALVTDQFIAEYYSEDPNAYYDISSREVTIDHVSRCDFWNLNRSAGTSDVQVSLSWTSANCGVNVPADLGVGRWDNTGLIWKDYGNGGTTGTANAGTVVSLAAQATFGPFALISTSTSNPLPIELVSFDAMQKGKAIDIFWTTASEINNDYFTVQRSLDNMNFDKVKDIKGLGNSTVMTNYCVMDECPYEGSSFYRLRQKDFDGKESYSETKRVEFHSDSVIGFNIYPNPATADNIQLLIDGMGKEELTVNIYDARGRLVNTQKIKPQTRHTRVMLTGQQNDCLIPGTYLITVTGVYFSESTKVIIE